MLHLLLYALLAIVVAGGLFLAATRFLPAGEQIAPPLRDEPVWELPAERSLQAEDIDHVRLPVALRGYRFAETDILLDRLAGELRARDAQIARLSGYPRPSPDHVARDHVAADDATQVHAAQDHTAQDYATRSETAPGETAPGETAPGEHAEDSSRFAPPPLGDDRG